MITTDSSLIISKFTHQIHQNYSPNLGVSLVLSKPSSVQSIDVLPSSSVYDALPDVKGWWSELAPLPST